MALVKVATTRLPTPSEPPFTSMSTGPPLPIAKGTVRLLITPFVPIEGPSSSIRNAVLISTDAVAESPSVS